MKGGTWRAGLITCVLVLAASVRAWVPTGGALRPDGPIAITLALNETAPAGSPGDLNAATTEAMALWNAVLQRVRLVPAPLAGEAWYENGRSEVFFDREMFGRDFPNGVLAVTATTEDRGTVVETDIIFNATRPWSVYHGAFQRTTSDVRRVAVHELGHLLGLDHPDEAGQTVSAIMNSTAGTIEVPSVDDETGVRALYNFGPGAPPVILVHPVSVTLLQGVATDLRVLAGGRGPFSYQWFKGGAAIPGATDARWPFVAGLGDAGDYTAVVRSLAGSTTSRVGRVAVTPATPPELTAQVRATTAVVGGSVALEGSLGGSAPMQLEWRKDGVLIPGASTLRLVLPDVQFSDAGRYTLTATNAAGGRVLDLGSLAVTPATPPRFTGELPCRAVGAGDSVSLDAPTTASPPVTYQWKKNGIDLRGQTTSRLLLLNFRGTDVGIYSVTMTNAAGQVTSEGGELTLGVRSGLQLSAQPTAVTEYSGATVSFGPEMDNGAVSFRWLKDGVPMVDSPPLPVPPVGPQIPGNEVLPRITGSEGRSLRIAQVTAADAGLYVLELSDGRATARSRGARLTVLPRPKPVLAAHPSHHIVAPGQAISLSAAARPRLGAGAVGTPPSYEDPAFQWFKDGVAIAGATDRMLSMVATTADTGRYFARLSNSGGSSDSEIAEVAVAAGSAALMPVQPGSVYFDAGYTEALRLFAVAMEVDRRRYARTVDEASWELLGPPPSQSPQTANLSFIPGVYDWVLRRGTVTERSHPFVQDYQPQIVPLIVLHPQGKVVVPGTAVSIGAQAIAYGPVTYQWQKDGVPIPGATGSGLSWAAFTSSEAGAYRVVATGALGSTTSEAAIVELRQNETPVITVQPTGRTVAERSAVTFTVGAAGPGLTYQWRRNGVPIPAATQTSLSWNAVPATDAGDYTVVVSDGPLSTTSRVAPLKVLAATRAPEILLQPAAETVAVLGGEATLSAGADGAPLPDHYQWRRNGVDIPGATDAKLRLSAVSADSAGTYSVIVTNSAGSATSRPATLTVDTRGRLVNLATRASVGREGDVLIAGFVIDGTEPRSLLIRGIGDQLSEFGVSGVLRDPVVSLHDAKGARLQINDDWFRTSEEVKAALQAAAKQVGAFAQREDARDGALLATLAPGSYTVKVEGLAATTGVGLVEIYELGKPGKGRLINLSSRAVVGTGASILIPGLVLNGLTPRRLLIRAVGPGLADFGVAGTLSDPVMTVFREGVEVARNDNWGEQANAANVALIRTAMATVGAFGLKDGSRDAALLLDLPPGSYTVQVAGVADATGVALVEVYEVAP